MAKLTRRRFLTRTTASAAALGALAGGFGARAVESLPHEVAVKAPPATVSEPLVVYVRDAARGEVAFLVGEREITRRDPALVARLLNVLG
jgi:hypothetical protein